MDLSIVIVNWNVKGLLKDCLESVYAYPPEAQYEVWVLDNASTDGSVEMIRQDYPQVHLLESATNIGFATGNNQAMRRCTGRYVLLLNPDTKVKPGALSKLLEFLDENPQAGGVGPRVLNPDETLQVSCYPAPTLTRELWRLLHLDKLKTYGIYDMSRWNPSEIRIVDIIQGACLLIRKAALDQVGLMDEEYFMYTEEVDLCYRLRKGGWRLYWLPQAEIIHYGGQSTQQVASEMFVRLYQTKLLYFRKNHGRIAYLAYKFILLAVSFLRVLISPLALLEPPQKRQRHLLLARNYRHLLSRLQGL